MADGKQTEIREMGLFEGCRPQDVRWIASVADTVDLPAGRTIVRRGERAREFVLVVRGRAEYADGDGPVVLAPGSFVGQDGLTEDRPHAHTVRTTTPVRLLVFSPGAFRGMINRMPAVGRRVLSGKVAQLHTYADGGYVPRREDLRTA